MKTLIDGLNHIMNGYMVKANAVICSHSKMLEQALKILIREGFIRGFFKQRSGHHTKCHVLLKYVNDNASIRAIEFQSKSGLRIHSKQKILKKAWNGVGVCILSTKIGVLTSDEAFSKGIGGECLFKVY